MQGCGAIVHRRGGCARHVAAAARFSARRRSFAFRAFAYLGRVPERIHLRKIGLLWRTPVARQGRFDRGKAAGELCIGAPKRGFGINVHVPGKIGHHEKQITELLGDLIAGSGLRGFVQFRHLLGDLVEHLHRIRPVEADSGGAFLQFHRAQKRRKAGGDPVKNAGL